MLNEVSAMKNNHSRLFCARLALFLIFVLCVVSVAVSASSASLSDLPESAEEMPFSPEEALLLPDKTDVSDPEGEASLFATFFSGGSGTESDPYLISSDNDLRNFALFINSGSRKYVTAYYALTNNISLNGEEWTPIGYYSDDTQYSCTFQGVFDGGGYTISDFVLTDAERRYLGFFGFVYNGSVYDLKLKNFVMDYSFTGYVYSGALIGRCIVNDGGKHEISGCSVSTDMPLGISVQVTDYPLYAGGLIGYLHSSAASTVTVSDCFSDISAFYTLSGSNKASDMTARTGGFIGYLAADGGSVAIENCYAARDVLTRNPDLHGTRKDNVYNAGFIGYIGGNQGTISVSGCYASGLVYTQAYGETYTGGFSGYTISGGSDVSITGAFSDGSVYAQSMGFASYTAGFTSITATASAGKLSISEAYTNCDVYDLGSEEAVAGKFSAYTTGAVTYAKCYSFTFSVCRAAEIEQPHEKVISGTDFQDPKIFDLDPTIWQAPGLGYQYPTLASLPFEKSKRYVYYFQSAIFLDAEASSFGETIVPDESVLDDDSIFEFDCFSRFPDDKETAVDSLIVEKDLILFANYSENFRSFTVTFFNGSEQIGDFFAPYSSRVIFPEPPVIPQTPHFYYEFAVWSETPDGTVPVSDPDNVHIYGNTSYYAIYRTISIDVWDGSSVSPFSSGDGTKESPYRIYNGSQLAYLSRMLVSYPNKFQNACYILATDIDLGGHEWTPIGTESTPFSGVFDGNGYHITGLTITKPTTYAGLFGVTENAVIRSLEVSDFTIRYTTDSNTFAGLIAGKFHASDGKANIQSCAAYGTLDVTSTDGSSTVGGLVGIFSSEKNTVIDLLDCIVQADVSAKASVNAMCGGIVGTMRTYSAGEGGIRRCLYTGSVTASASSDGSAYAGGVAGYLFGEDPGWVGLASLMRVDSDVSSCIIDGSVCAVRDAMQSFAGYVCGYQSEYIALADNYAVTDTALEGKTLRENAQLSDRAALCADTFLQDTLGFDLINVWAAQTEAFPLLRVLSAARDIFRLDTAAFDTENGKLSVSLRVGFRDPVPFTVICGVYDERGRMIYFDTLSFPVLSTVSTVSFDAQKLENAKTATLLVLNSNNLTLLQKPVYLS